MKQKITFSPRSRSALFVGIILLAPTLFFFIGIPLPSIAKDAEQYHTYAVNLVTGHGYSLDGTTFSDTREPGYPLFLATVYALFGVGNLFALVTMQTVLLGLLGVLVFRLFARQNEEYLGCVAGLATSLLPSYGLYTHIMNTEILFATALGALLYMCTRIALTNGDSPWQWYAGLGLLCGYTTLVRVQLLFLLPFLIFFFYLFARPLSWRTLQKLAITCALFVTVIGSWVLYVHSQTGAYAITSGRPEVVLHLRAVRAQLSYAELTEYAHDWVRRSVTGGTGTTFLMDNEFARLGQAYNRVASTSASVATVKQQNISILLANPGHYLYGNLIEVIKLAWIEHDFSDFLNRYVRAGLYVVLYGLFLFGIAQLMYAKKDRDIATISTTAIFFVVYNFLILTPFDTIPRYNTPYLVFYLLVGIAGIVLWRRRTTLQKPL